MHSYRKNKFGDYEVFFDARAFVALAVAPAALWIAIYAIVTLSGG